MEKLLFENFETQTEKGKEDAVSICSHLKLSLGKREYDFIKEFFYHVCVDKYAYKVLVTRRAYLLYRIFYNIFTHIKEESIHPDKKFEPFGTIYNSHSISLLEKENLNKNDKCLIVDDIIVNGRAVSDTLNRILDLNFDQSNVEVWCILCNSAATCISDKVKERLGTYKLVSVKKWKQISDCFTNAILKNKWGYTSYLSTYQINNKGNEIFIDKLKSYLEAEEGKSVIKNDNFQEEMEGCYIWFDERTVKFSKTNEDKFHFDTMNIDCIRVYCYKNTVSIIPYIFLPSIESNESFNLGINLLKNNCINSIPKIFDNCNNDSNLSALFLKWVINVVGKKRIEEFLCQFVDTEKISVIEMNCKATYNFDCNDIVPIENIKETKIVLNEIAPPDISDYINCFTESVKQVKRHIDQDNSNSNDMQWILAAVETYVVAERVNDVRRIKENLQQYMGIRMRDAINILWDILYSENTTMNETDFSAFFENVIKALLSAFIYIWDIGESSYDIKPISGDKVVITGLTRHGEQSFRTKYRLYDDIYSYFYRFTKMTLEDRILQLIKFSDYLAENKPESKEKIREFISYIRHNEDYLFDVFVVEPESEIDMSIVTNYINCNYVP